MRTLLPALLFLSTPAFAGGIGAVVNAGAHTEDVYFYSDHAIDGGEAVPYPDIDDYDQFVISQNIPHFGAGLEFILGDRDDKIMGVTRFYWQMDTPQGDPAELTTQVDSQYVVGAYREENRHVGMGAIGLTWGLVEVGPVMLNAVGHIGTGFLTNDHTEFFMADVGPGVSWRAARQVIVFGDVNYQMRWRKNVSHSANVVAGIRYMFD